MLVRLLLLGLYVCLSCSVYASTDAIDTAYENCNRVESPLDVALGCDVQINCLFNTATINCSELTLVQLVKTCDNFDIQTCADVATLTMVAIDDAILQFQTIDSTTQLNNSLRAFLNEDYQAAIDFYENVTFSLEYFPHYILELGLGIVYLRFDNPDVALIQFDKSLNLEFYNPVGFYYRGNTYEERGNSVRALRDHYLYDLLADEQVKILLPLRTFRIQIPNSEVWGRYPVYTIQQTGLGWQIQDNSLDPVESIVVSFVDDNETLVIADWLDIVAGDEAEILFFERDPQNPLRYILNINQQDIPNSVLSGKTEISVVVSDEHLDLYILSSQGISSTWVTSLASQTLEDVRQDNDARLCEGSGLSFIAAGDTVAILPSLQSISLRSEPNIESDGVELVLDIDGDNKPFTVEDGGQCDGNGIWWELSNGEMAGWLFEHQQFESTSYQLFPIDRLQLWEQTLPTPLQFLGG
jgi:tetratricopeptide (TPR) repeat protein